MSRTFVSTLDGSTFWFLRGGPSHPRTVTPSGPVSRHRLFRWVDGQVNDSEPPPLVSSVPLTSSTPKDTTPVREDGRKNVGPVSLRPAGFQEYRPLTLPNTTLPRLGEGRQDEGREEKVEGAFRPDTEGQRRKCFTPTFLVASRPTRNRGRSRTRTRPQKDKTR